MEGFSIILFIAGALGALTKDLVKDNCIELPKKINHKLQLGFIGGIITGGITGYLIDGQFITAFIAGYTGSSLIEELIRGKISNQHSTTLTIEDIIRKIAKEEMVDPDLAVRVAKCESNLNPNAININKDGSKDQGIFQINNKYHPEVSDQEAFDPYFSTRFFCKAFKNGNLSWWNATKSCWDI